MSGAVPGGTTSKGLGRMGVRGLRRTKRCDLDKSPRPLHRDKMKLEPSTLNII